MTPTPPDDAHSPLATLRQLKEMLDAGAITPQEFEALKQRLIFGAAPGAAPAGGPAVAAVPEVPAAWPPPAAPPAAERPPVPPAPAAEVPATPYLDTPAALTPEATPLLAPELDWLAASTAPLPLIPVDDAADEYAEAPAAERRNPLNLVFAIGGLLLFLGVMAYLAWGRPRTPDEHLTSTTQTAADTTAVVPDTGPQAEQLTLPPAAAPETVRVVPPAPRPAATPVADTAQPQAAPVKAPVTTAPAPAAAPAATSPKATPAKPAAPAAADTAAGKQ